MCYCGLCPRLPLVHNFLWHHPLLISLYEGGSGVFYCALYEMLCCWVLTACPPRRPFVPAGRLVNVKVEFPWFSPFVGFYTQPAQGKTMGSTNKKRGKVTFDCLHLGAYGDNTLTAAWLLRVSIDIAVTLQRWQNGTYCLGSVEWSSLR